MFRCLAGWMARYGEGATLRSNRAGEHGRRVFCGGIADGVCGIWDWNKLEEDFIFSDGPKLSVDDGDNRGRSKLIERLIVDVWLMWDWVAYAGLLTVSFGTTRWDCFDCVYAYALIRRGFGRNFAGMQSQIVCHGCRTVLLYPRGAPSVCCAVCHAVTNVPPPPAMEMARLICGGCQTLLMYTCSATTVRCSCCDTVNLVRPVSSIAHVNCGQCQTVLMYPYGAPSVKCAVCNFITNVGGVTPVRPLPPALPASSGNSYSIPSTSVPTNQSRNVTVVVENPMTVDDKGKLVSNVVVGVTSGGKK